LAGTDSKKGVIIVKTTLMCLFSGKIGPSKPVFDENPRRFDIYRGAW
jgi:hypothetical protein